MAKRSKSAQPFAVIGAPSASTPFDAAALEGILDNLPPNPSILTATSRPIRPPDNTAADLVQGVGKGLEPDWRRSRPILVGRFLTLETGAVTILTAATLSAAVFGAFTAAPYLDRLRPAPAPQAKAMEGQMAEGRTAEAPVAPPRLAAPADRPASEPRQTPARRSTSVRRGAAHVRGRTSRVAFVRSGNLTARPDEPARNVQTLPQGDVLADQAVPAPSSGPVSLSHDQNRSIMTFRKLEQQRLEAVDEIRLLRQK